MKRLQEIKTIDFTDKLDLSGWTCTDAVCQVIEGIGHFHIHFERTGTDHSGGFKYVDGMPDELRPQKESKHCFTACEHNSSSTIVVGGFLDSKNFGLSVQSSTSTTEYTDIIDINMIYEVA